MSVDNFIPAIWSAQMLMSLKKEHVYGQAGVVNRDYEGEISAQGDRVKINSIGPVTIGTYTKNTNIGDPETLTDSQKELVINQAKYFNFQVDDVDKAQTKLKVMGGAMVEAAYGIRDATDNFIAGLYTGVAAATSGTANGMGDDTTPVVLTPATVYEKLVDMGVLLTEQNVPTGGRWCVLPPWAYGMLLKDDRFVKVGSVKSDAVIANGEVGEAAGFRILQSNNVPQTGGVKYKIIAGHPMAISYADQIASVEAFRPEKRFGDAVKGLHVYGAKLVRNNAIAVLTANKA